MSYWDGILPMNPRPHSRDSWFWAPNKGWAICILPSAQLSSTTQWSHFLDWVTSHTLKVIILPILSSISGKTGVLGGKPLHHYLYGLGLLSDHWWFCRPSSFFHAQSLNVKLGPQWLMRWNTLKGNHGRDGKEGWIFFVPSLRLFRFLLSGIIWDQLGLILIRFPYKQGRHTVLLALQGTMQSDCINRAPISYRQHYWSQMLACCFFHTTFFSCAELSFIWDQYRHLALCLRRNDPNQFLSNG